MAISYEECQAILKQFQDRHRLLMMRDGIHGVQVAEPGVLQILTVTPQDETVLPKQLQIPANFTYRYEDKDKTLQTKSIVTEIYRALTTESSTGAGNTATKRSKVVPDAKETRAENGCEPGDEARGDMWSYGTAGWNFYLNNVPLCISNWHVLCARGNATPLGSDIVLSGENWATLYMFDPVHIHRNVWDVAFARYRDPHRALDTMRPCEDGSRLPYPDRLSPRESVKIGDGAAYYKVGAREPTCRKGHLVAVGNVTVDYDDARRYFEGQLIFTKMTDPGDSGAVIVRESDVTVTGLSFAGNSSESVANPLFLRSWIPNGFRRLPGIGEIPMFTSSDPDIASSVSFGSGPPADISISTPSDPRDLPGLRGGKFFLGVAHWRYDAGWIIPVPPPISPNVPVEKIILRETSGDAGYGIPSPAEVIYLCFG
jgi:hypothetical protein